MSFCRDKCFENYSRWIDFIYIGRVRVLQLTRLEVVELYRGYRVWLWSLLSLLWSAGVFLGIYPFLKRAPMTRFLSIISFGSKFRRSLYNYDDMKLLSGSSSDYIAHSSLEVKKPILVRWCCRRVYWGFERKHRMKS